VVKKSIYDPTIVIKPYTSEVDSPRYREHYGWLHIAGDESITRQIDVDSDAFQLALQWYGNFTSSYGHKNHVLNEMIDANPSAVKHLSRSEYDAHFREYICKGVYWFGWCKDEEYRA